MAEIMDPFAYELLAHPPPPGFDQFRCGGGATMNITIEQMDDYFRAIGILPPRPPAADAPPSPAATFRLRFAVDDNASNLPPTCELPAAVPQLSPASDNSATPYDADIDASLRATERHAAERPTPDYLATTQGGRIDPAARAALIQWMISFSRPYFLDEASIIHRAVSYVDRYLSARPLLPLPDPAADSKYRLRVLGAVAVYAAAKVEDPHAARDLSATGIACWCGYDTTRRDVLDAERDMVAALGCRLAGPTAHTFVDRFVARLGQRRREEEEEDLVELRRVAHHIADTSLFDYRCLKLLPSAVAAAAIFLARLALFPSHESEKVRRWSGELEEKTGYRPADVRDGVECMYRLMDAPGFVIMPVFFADRS